MKKLFVLIMCVSAVSACFGQEEQSRFGTIMLTDGVSLIPNAVIPTPSEVGTATSKATQAYDAAMIVYSSSVVIGAQADELSIKTSALNGTTIVYGSCIAFGSWGVEVNTNASAIILAQEFPGVFTNGTGTVFSDTSELTHINLYVHYTDVLKAHPIVQTASTLTASQWEATETLDSELTTYLVEGSPVECYRLMVSIPANVTQLFLRTKGELKDNVISQLNVTHDLTVNGIRGKNEVNELGMFKSGLLVEEIDMTTFGEGVAE